MRIYRTKESTQNMCDSCQHCIASCGELKPKFGNGVGGDNVVECAVYMPYGARIGNIPEYIIKGEIVKRGDHEWVYKGETK